MQLADQRRIAARPEAVWAAILDPQVLMACIPGCESMTGSPADGYEAVVVQKIGPVKARFAGIVSLSDIVEGRSVRISGEGKGGAAGFAKGGALVTLVPADGGTALSYQVEASVGGKLAQLGSRMIDGLARKLADQFFERFQAVVEGPPVHALADAEDAAPAGSGKAKSGWFRRLVGN